MPLTIANIRAWPVDVPLTDAFVISSGRVTVAENAFVAVELGGGVVGYGEIAPFPDVSGETRADSIAAVGRFRTVLEGRPAAALEETAAVLAAEASDRPAARAGVECAVLDAYCRAVGVPVWEHLGANDVRPRETDVTIPILSSERSVALAGEWAGRGFRTLKMKIGADIDADAKRVRAIADRLPDVSFVLDANAALTPDEAVSALAALGAAREQVVLYEQPVAHDDLDGMAEVRRRVEVPVAADESVRSAADVMAVLSAGAADVINLKIMKAGLWETIRIAELTRSGGARLMIGGMVETRLAMSFSLGLVMGMGGIEFLDLDTPLLMAEDPVAGGYRYDGAEMTAWREPGTGVTPRHIPGPDA